MESQTLNLMIYLWFNDEWIFEALNIPADDEEPEEEFKNE